MDQYPTLNFLVSYGSKIAIAAAILAAAAGVAATAAGAGALWTVAGIVGAAIGYGVVRSYVELIQLVTDMLMPK